MIIFILFLILLVVAPIQAQDNNDTVELKDSHVNTYTDLNEKFNQSEPGSTVSLNENYSYDSNVDESLSDGVVLSKNMTVVGHDNACIDGNNSARLVTIESNCSVVFENITFRNGFSNSSGGAIYLKTNSSLVLKNCLFENNKVYNSNGGAVYASRLTNLEIYNCEFSNNTSIRVSNLVWEEFKQGMGSAICQSIGSNMTLVDSVFRKNNAYLSTILLISYLEGDYNISTLFIGNCLLENNTSFSSGVVYLDELGQGEIINTTFKNNNITDHSGVLVLDACVSALLENCLFDSNSAVNGGSIHIKVFEGFPANVSIINTTFSNNRAAQQGGAIYSNSGIIDIINSTFENNSCSGNGGAILTKKGLIQIFDSKFINNSAENGGALSLNSNVTINNVTFIDNSASVKGGAVYSKLNAVAVINSTYLGNSAPVAGNVYGAFNANVTQSGSYWGEVTLSIRLESPWDMSLAQKIKLKFSGTKSHTSGWYKTNNYGILTYKLPKSLIPGKYTVTITMESGICFVNSKTIKVTRAPVKLTAKKLTTTYKSGKVFKIYVKNSKTKKPINGAKLKLKVYTGKKYKTYTLTSDKNGLIKFKTSILSVGTHKIEITAGNTNIKLSKVKTSIKVKKASAIISAEKIVKKPSKIKITVKNKASGNPIKKNKFTVKVHTGKEVKTYKIKTDSKGILKISTKKLKKGSHKIDVILKSGKYSINKRIKVKIK